MGDTTAERRAVADVVESKGARAIWFEEFGRDADAEEAYLTQVDASTIYIGLLNELYGRPNPPDGDSATEMEYRRAREAGKRVGVYVAANAPGREGALSRFIERVRFFVTTENYASATDLARRVGRRLDELAAEGLSPWIKLGDLVFRADELVDSGEKITIRARASEEIAHHLEEMRDNGYGRQRLDYVSRSRVASGELGGVRRTTRSSGAEEVMVELVRVNPAKGDAMRVAMSGYSADQLVELGVRRIFLGEPLPDTVSTLGFVTEPRINIDDLHQAFDLPNDFAEAVVRLVVTEGLVGHGHAQCLLSLALGPRTGDVRRLALEWEDPRTGDVRRLALEWEDPRIYQGIEPTRRRVAGKWRRG